MINGSIIKKRILIIGSNGMLGQRLAQFFMSNGNIELLCTSVEDESFIPEVSYKQLDIGQKNKVREIIIGFFPDFVINTAAFTNVDKSESEKETAWKINVTGVENIALYSWAVDAHLIHISTDYIFDGKKGPYTEEDKPNPISYYGRTKLASENSIKISGVRHSIIRSNVLYGPAKFSRPDYVKWVINSLSYGEKIRIVTDQISNPTYIDDIVIAINKIIEFKKEGTYNIAGAEIISRFDFTLRIAKYFGLDEKLILPIITKELNQAAQRPLKSGLITLKAQTELGYKPHTIEETFELMKKEMNL
ncbi:MAG: dTDP-4-dehydrorhamnose reductase [Bacteroidota bacterium]